jgi:hypothetical protein
MFFMEFGKEFFADFAVRNWKIRKLSNKADFLAQSQVISVSLSPTYRPPLFPAKSPKAAIE